VRWVERGYSLGTYLLVIISILILSDLGEKDAGCLFDCEEFVYGRGSDGDSTRIIPIGLTKGKRARQFVAYVELAVDSSTV
jgi:hypothetical protein